MKSRYMFDGIPPSHEARKEAAPNRPFDMSRVPRGFVRGPSSSKQPVAHSPDDQIGVALDERSFESLQRIARYLGVEGASECSRAELLAKIRQALS